MNLSEKEALDSTRTTHPKKKKNKNKISQERKKGKGQKPHTQHVSLKIQRIQRN